MPQPTHDTNRPAATALNWNGLTVDQWNVLSVSGWDTLLVDHVPTGGAGMLEYSPTGNRLTQTDPVTGDVGRTVGTTARPLSSNTVNQQ
ncbi:MAG: hypothetical protein JNL58_27190 [Planctomyces sp.]|nr:hypothetical protein [Planctomyces sp.]